VLAALRKRGLAPDGTDRALALGVESLGSSLGDDGRPVACQNAWEDAVGRFSHTAATFLEAYASVAATDHPDADRALVCAEAVYEGLDHLWVPGKGAYAMCETTSGELDERYDSASLALVSAHRAYDEVGTVDDGRLDRLTGHVESVVDGLFRDPSESDVAGLARYGGDDWRADGQTEPKVWTVSTGLAANAAVGLAVLCAGRDDDGPSASPGAAGSCSRSSPPAGRSASRPATSPNSTSTTGPPTARRRSGGRTPSGWRRSHSPRSATTSNSRRPGTVADGAVPVRECIATKTHAPGRPDPRRVDSSSNDKQVIISKNAFHGSRPLRKRDDEQPYGASGRRARRMSGGLTAAFRAGRRMVDACDRPSVYAVGTLAIAGAGVLFGRAGSGVLFAGFLFVAHLFAVQGFLRYGWPHLQRFHERRDPDERDPTSMRFEGFSADVRVFLTLLVAVALAMFGLILLELRFA